VNENIVGPKAEQTRQALLDAAVDRYGRDGFKASSVAAIARDVGVSRTLAYAYFDDGEGLFRAALDLDAAAVIHEGFLDLALTDAFDESWRDEVLVGLLAALDSHPLARRVMAGLEPHVTSQMLNLPALEELRAAVGERLLSGQSAGVVRGDIDAALIGRGAVNLWIGMLMAVVQFGADGLEAELPSVRAVFEAAVASAGSGDGEGQQ
jgi:AcrR family transcriptional regulator